MAMGVNPFLFNSYWPSASMNLQKLAKEKGTDEKPTSKKEKDKQRDKKRVSDRGPVAKNWPGNTAAPKGDAGSSQPVSVKSSQKSTTKPSSSLLTEVEKTVASAHSKLTSNFSPTASSSLLPPYEGLPPKATDLRRSSTGLPIQTMLKSPVDKQLSSAASTSSKASESGDVDDVILDLSSNKKRPADSTSSPIDDPKPQSDLSSNASRSPALSPTGPLLSPNSSSSGVVAAKKGVKTKRRGFSLEQAVQKLKEKTGEKVSSTSSTGESIPIFTSLPTVSSVKDSVNVTTNNVASSSTSSKSQNESEHEIPAKKTNQTAGSYPGQSCDPDSTHNEVAPENTSVPKPSSDRTERFESLLVSIFALQGVIKHFTD